MLLILLLSGSMLLPTCCDKNANEIVVAMAMTFISLQHDGKKRNQGWHLEKIEVTDIEALKTWVFLCEDWLSIFEKPHYSNKRDLIAEDIKMPQTGNKNPCRYF